jgi:hypothetical protein
MLQTGLVGDQLATDGGGLGVVMGVERFVASTV